MGGNKATVSSLVNVFLHVKSRPSGSLPIVARDTVMLIALSLCTQVYAQQDTAREPAQTPVRATSAFEAREERRRVAVEKVIPEINVPAGEKLDKFVEFLSEQTGANIVVEESLKGMELPALKLRNVSITAALEAIRVNSKQMIAARFSEDRGPGALLVTISSNNLRGEKIKPTKICRVFRLVFTGGERGPIVAGAIRTESVEKPLDDETNKALEQKVQNISTAAQKACRTLARANGQVKTDADYPIIEVHAPTHLLLVTGEEADVDLVGQIISALGGIAMNTAPRVPDQPTTSPSRTIK